MSENKNIAIVGGGPAGLASAVFLAREGHVIHLYEKSSFPVDKVCGEGIMPSGVEVLAELGALELLRPAMSHPFKGIHYINGEKQECQGSFGRSCGMGVRRLHLSEVLWSVARQYDNIIFHERASISNVSHNGKQFKLSMGPDRFYHDYLIGADGLRSIVARSFGLVRKGHLHKRTGSRFHFHCRPWSDRVEVHWKNGLEAYVTPVGESMIELAFVWDRDFGHQCKPLTENILLDMFPVLFGRLKNSPVISRFQATGPLHHETRPVPVHLQGKLFLIGDALGFVDGITGEGISLALEQAMMLPDLLENRQASTALEKTTLHYKGLTEIALWFTRRSGMRRLMISLMSACPFLFDQMLQLNMGRGFRPLLWAVRLWGRFVQNYRAGLSDHQDDQNSSSHPLPSSRSR